MTHMRHITLEEILFNKQQNLSPRLHFAIKITLDYSVFSMILNWGEGSINGLGGVNIY